MPTIGIIGGSGIYDLPGLTRVREVRLATPFGSPSDAFRVGRLGEADVVFLPRHGRGHVLTPTEVPARANIWGFKKLGVERLVSFSAVGSLREELAPGHVVIPDQAIDRTKGRAQTFFGEGVVAHVAFGDPTCATVRAALAKAARDAGAPKVHEGGTSLVMEGPAFSTRAESELHRRLGADLIGMTMFPEAKLAREAELCYGVAAFVTDYDAWKDEHVTADAVVAVLHQNAELARGIAARVVATLSTSARTCGCGDALSTAILTQRDRIPAAARKKLALILGRHLPPPAKAAPRRAPKATPPARKPAGRKSKR